MYKIRRIEEMISQIGRKNATFDVIDYKN